MENKRVDHEKNMVCKRYSYTYDDYEQSKVAATMLEEIIKDPELPEIESIEIGNWGDSWEGSCQALIDGMITHHDKFSHIKDLKIGIMDSEDCEVSWIVQGDYSGLWGALPQLKSLTIQGSMELRLGEIQHENLEELEIICGGLPVSVLKSIQNAKLPALKKLILYIGIENYGFDGSPEDIETMLAESDFPSLQYLGLLDSEIQDDIAQIAVACKYMSQLDTLDLSCGSLSDKGGQILLDTIPKYANIQKLDLHFHFMSEKMMQKLKKLPIIVDVNEPNKPERYRDEIYYYAMVTE